MDLFQENYEIYAILFTLRNLLGELPRFHSMIFCCFIDIIKNRGFGNRGLGICVLLVILSHYCVIRIFKRVVVIRFLFELYLQELSGFCSGRNRRGILRNRGRGCCRPHREEQKQQYLHKLMLKLFQ